MCTLTYKYMVTVLKNLNNYPFDLSWIYCRKKINHSADTICTIWRGKHFSRNTPTLFSLFPDESVVRVCQMAVSVQLTPKY